MYTQEKLRRKLLSTGLFRIAHGVDAAFGDADTVLEMFVQSAVALERDGWDVEAVLRDRDPISCSVALLTMADVERSMDDWCEYPDHILLLIGLHHLLELQFSGTDPMARGQFLEDLASLGGAR